MDDLIRFWQDADTIAGRVIEALANLKPQSGATPKMNARSLALFTAYRFRMQKLPLTSYQDGTYMRVLELLFKELFPSSKKAGYRRHGKWAIEEIGKA